MVPESKIKKIPLVMRNVLNIATKNLKLDYINIHAKDHEIALLAENLNGNKMINFLLDNTKKKDVSNLDYVQLESNTDSIFHSANTIGYVSHAFNIKPFLIVKDGNIYVCRANDAKVERVKEHKANKLNGKNIIKWLDANKDSKITITRDFKYTDDYAQDHYDSQIKDGVISEVSDLGWLKEMITKKLATGCYSVSGDKKQKQFSIFSDWQSHTINLIK